MSQLSLPQSPCPVDFPVHPTKTRWGGLHISERRILLMLGDLGMVSAALLAALWLRIPWLSDAYTWPQLFVLKLHWWLVLWGLWIPLSIIVDCYDLRSAASPAKGIVYTAACAFVVCVLYFMVPGVSAPLTYSRLAWFIFAFLAVLGVAAWRLFYAKFISQRTFTRRVLIVGAGWAGRTLASTIHDQAGATGIEIAGFVDDDQALYGEEVNGHRVLGTSEHLSALAEQFKIDEIVIAVMEPHRICPELFEAIVQCWERGIPITPMSLYFEEVIGAIPVRHIGQNLLALVDRQNELMLRVWAGVRRVADIVVGAIGLLLLAPFFPFIALAIRLDCPGPIFYRQQRIGRYGKTFWLTKLRSMVPDAEKNGAVWAQQNDDRITRVGRFMRKTRIDELPQLWNILKGDMTLIGPRPERPEFVQRLDDLLPFYAIRHSVKPGITGWAQVKYHYGSSEDDALMKLQYDLYYVKHRGPVLDTLIALHTIRVMVTMQGV